MSCNNFVHIKQERSPLGFHTIIPDLSISDMKIISKNIYNQIDTTGDNEGNSIIPIPEPAHMFY